MSLPAQAPEPVRIVDVDLAAGDPAALGADGCPVHLVVWHDGLALGAVDLPADQLPMTSGAVHRTAVDAALPAVWGHLFAPQLEFGTRSAPVSVRDVEDLEDPWCELHHRLHVDDDDARASQVTVVVCTRDRPDALERCLTSTERLRPRPGAVVVVDNASVTDATRRTVERHRGVRYVREDRPGLDLARNAGVAAATTDIVAFTDDDVVVHPGWVGQVVRAFDERTAAVTGQVLPVELATAAQTLFEQDWGLGKGFVPRRFRPGMRARFRSKGLPAWQVGAGANMAFRRSVFDEVGSFDPRLDVGAAGCSGDSEMWYRILVAGHDIQYAPTAVVHHHHRADRSALKRQIFAYMRGHTAALLVQYERSGDPGNLVRLAVVLPRNWARTVVARLNGSLHPERMLLRHEVAGALAGVGYYLRYGRR